MLFLTIKPREVYDEENNLFFISKEQVLQLEHSLVSLTKWESTWHLPFFSIGEKTIPQTIDYIRCMTITQNIDPNIYNYISQENIYEVNKYIEEPMTATTFRKDEHRVVNREIITSEIIYYWMISLNIPFQCEKWHLNRLLTLINVCNIKNQPSKKMKKSDLYARNRNLNAIRRQNLGTNG